MKYIAFIAIAFLVVLPWFFHPGYLLLLDWPGYPHLSDIHIDQTGGIASIPVQLLLYSIGSIVGAAHAQKILVLFILALSGCATMLLAKTISPKQQSSFSLYAAGIFAMLNPFVYNRIQMGHIYLLAAYALTPLAILCMIRFLRKPSIGSGLLASCISSIVIATNIHHLVLLPLTLLIFFWNEDKKAAISLHAYTAFIAPFLIIAALIITAVAANPDAALHTLNKNDFLIFEPVAQCSKSVALDSLLLAAQWRHPEITHAPCTSPLFFMGSILLTGIIAIGAVRNKRLAIGAIACLILAITPIIPAMRDSAKFLADLAIIESILLALSIEILPAVKQRGASLAILILVCVLGIPMLWGLSGTITPQEYPASWYAWDTQLANAKTKPTVLFLPWHLYMPFDFTNKATIVNPAKSFFTHATVIQGDNLEIRQGERTIPTESNRHVSQTIEDILTRIHTNSFPEELRTVLIQEHIQYIALSHGSPEETAYKTVLGNIPYLHATVDAAGLTVWEFEESPETHAENSQNQ